MLLRRALAPLLLSLAAFNATRAQSSLFSSVSSVASPTAGDSTSRRLRWQPVMPTYRFTYNSHLPYSLNDGAQSAGRGGSMDLTTGIRAQWGPVRLYLIPEFTWSANQDFPPPASPPN